jgi:flagellin
MGFKLTDSAPEYTITEGSKTVTIENPTAVGATAVFTGSETASSALQSINAQLAAGGITDIQAVDTGVSTGAGEETFSLQGAQAFTATAVAGANSTGTVTTVNGTSSADAPTTTGNGALNAVNAVTAAVQLLGSVQGTVGAGENDLNYAIGLANSQITNFSATESSIRDADVATEAANLTKAQVLEQASVAAMAQANSAPQAILSLLKT